MNQPKWISEWETEDLKFWDQFYWWVTDPNKHDPEKFRYLIHAFNPMAIITKIGMMQTQVQDIAGWESFDESDGDQWIDLFHNPFQIGKRVSVSMSLIDQDHIGTWWPIWLILWVPKENIVRTANTDLWTSNFSKKRLLEMKKYHSILSGDTILASSWPNSYNELVAFAKTAEAGEIRVIGFFAKTDEDWEFIDVSWWAAMENTARNSWLPFIKIPASLDTQNHSFSHNETYPAIFTYKWKYYYFSSTKNPWNGNWTSMFCNSGSSMVSYFLTPEELGEIYEIFKNIYPDECDNLWTKGDVLAQYEIVQKKHFGLEVENCEDWTVKSIRFLGWYGKDTTRYTIVEHSAMKVNADKEIENMKKSLRGGIITWDSPWIYLDFNEASNEIESRLWDMNEDDRAKIRRFLENNREKINSVYTTFWRRSWWFTMKDYTWLIKWILDKDIKF